MNHLRMYLICKLRVKIIGVGYEIPHFYKFSSDDNDGEILLSSRIFVSLHFIFTELNTIVIYALNTYHQTYDP